MDIVRDRDLLVLEDVAIAAAAAAPAVVFTDDDDDDEWRVMLECVLGWRGGEGGDF